MDSGVQSFTQLRHFIGVVENRNDPQELGRVKVRIYSVHSENNEDVKREHLPWAMVLNPITSASMSGIGTSPTGMVEGTWVFGVFLDENEYQMPLVMGTLLGNPSEAATKARGFSDPNEIYPLDEEDLSVLGESSVNRHARAETAEEHATLLEKREKKISGVQQAQAPKVSQVQPDKAASYYERPSWDEPHPRFGGQGKMYPSGVPQSVYPLNHVQFTEAGHLFEVDDTPGAERIHWFHTKGTFQEVQPDGNRVTKINGTDYEIVIKDKDVLVKGNVNVRVEGDARLYVKGDMYTEVEKDYFLSVGGDYIKKVAGNEAKEIISDKATVVNRNVFETIHGETEHIKTGQFTETLANTHTESIKGKEEIKNFANTARTVASGSNVPANMKTLVEANTVFMTGSDMLLQADATQVVSSQGDQTIKTSAAQQINVGTTQTMSISSTQDITANVTNINNNVNVTGTVDASVQVLANSIDLDGHVHPQTGGTTADGDKSVDTGASAT
tara:strand:+ start:2596 stop:4098 length:1503 start_codon:yes stop_codon:yes gene_type:complete